MTRPRTTPEGPSLLPPERLTPLLDGLDAYWDSPSEYHSALDALEAELAAALNRGDYWRDSNDLTGQKLVAAEAERDALEKALREIRDYYEAVYAPGDQAYQAAIVARAALGDTP